MKKSLHLLLAALLVTTVSACNDDPLFEITGDPPVANAGPDQTVEDADNSGDEIVNLDGSASTAGDDPIATYSWSEADTVLVGASVDGGRTVSVNFAVGVHDVTLTVTDEAGRVGTDDVTITVTGEAVIPELPIVTIAAPADNAEFDQGDTDITFMGSAVDQFDVEIPPEDLEWTSDVNGVLGTGNVLDVDPSTLTAGPHVITLTAVDSEGFEGTSEINIVINEALDVVSFADDILPYFVDNGCTGCHGAAVQLGDGIRLDSYTEVSTGSNGNGPLIVAGDAADVTAILIPKLEEVGHNDGPDDQGFVDNFLAQWIDDGAIDN